MSGGDKRIPFADFVLAEAREGWYYGELFFMSPPCFFSKELSVRNGWRGATKDSWTIDITWSSVTLYRYSPELENGVKVKLTKAQAKAFRFLTKERKELWKANKIKEQTRRKTIEEKAQWWP